MRNGGEDIAQMLALMGVRPVWDGPTRRLVDLEVIPLALLLFNVGVEVGQIGFVLLVLALERSFRVLEVRWPQGAELAPGYAVGCLGAYWTIQRTLVMLTGP